MRLRGSPEAAPDDFPWFSEEQLREMRQHIREWHRAAPSIG